MSIAEVTSRIAQIQGQLSQLAAPAAPARQEGATFSTVLGAAQAGLADDAAWSTNPLAPALSTAAVPSTSAGPSAGATADGLAVVEEARKYLGIPYLWGGTDPDQGLDCSGLVQLVYKQFGIDLPRVSYQQATAGRPVAGMAEARPGDILAFDSPVDHVGIYIGDGKMIEAPRTGLDVRVVDVYETPTAIRRVLPDQPVAGVAAARTVASSLPASTPYASLFTQAAQRHGVSPTLLAAVAQQESGFNARAVSPAGAQGLMQLMPATASGLGVHDSFDPTQAVDGAARLLKDLLGEFGRVDLALAAYNAGPGAVKRYGGIPPYPETQKYVPAVLAHKASLERA